MAATAAAAAMDTFMADDVEEEETVTEVTDAEWVEIQRPAFEAASVEALAAFSSGRIVGSLVDWRTMFEERFIEKLDSLRNGRARPRDYAFERQLRDQWWRVFLYVNTPAPSGYERALFQALEGPFITHIRGSVPGNSGAWKPMYLLDAVHAFEFFHVPVQRDPYLADCVALLRMMDRTTLRKLAATPDSALSGTTDWLGLRVLKRYIAYLDGVDPAPSLSAVRRGYELTLEGREDLEWANAASAAYQLAENVAHQSLAASQGRRHAKYEAGVAFEKCFRAELDKHLAPDESVPSSDTPSLQQTHNDDDTFFVEDTCHDALFVYHLANIDQDSSDLTGWVYELVKMISHLNVTYHGSTGSTDYDYTNLQFYLDVQASSDIRYAQRRLLCFFRILTQKAAESALRGAFAIKSSSAADYAGLQVFKRNAQIKFRNDARVYRQTNLQTVLPYLGISNDPIRNHIGPYVSHLLTPSEQAPVGPAVRMLLREFLSRTQTTGFRPRDAHTTLLAARHSLIPTGHMGALLTVDQLLRQFGPEDATTQQAASVVQGTQAALQLMYPRPAW